MSRVLMLALLVGAVPGLAVADEMLRWRDARGRLHYSNVTRSAPADAAPVKATVGTLSLAPAEPGTSATGSAPVPSVLEARAAAGRGCCPFGGAYAVVASNPHELADQVKQASLLDALGVSWRKCGCL